MAAARSGKGSCRSYECTRLFATAIGVRDGSTLNYTEGNDTRADLTVSEIAAGHSLSPAESKQINAEKRQLQNLIILCSTLLEVIFRNS